MKFILIIALVTVGCGGPASAVKGAACTPGAPPSCSSGSTGLFCESSVWAEFNCGSSGCQMYAAGTDAGTAISCLFLGEADGSRCPLSAPAQAWCDADAKKLHVCTANPPGASFVARACETGCTSVHDGAGISTTQCSP